MTSDYFNIVYRTHIYYHMFGIWVKGKNTRAKHKENDQKLDVSGSD